MFRKYLLPLGAMAMLGFAVVFVAGGAPVESKVAPPIAPSARSPIDQRRLGTAGVTTRTSTAFARASAARSRCAATMAPR